MPCPLALATPLSPRQNRFSRQEWGARRPIPRGPTYGPLNLGPLLPSSPGPWTQGPGARRVGAGLRGGVPARLHRVGADSCASLQPFRALLPEGEAPMEPPKTHTPVRAAPLSSWLGCYTPFHNISICLRPILLLLTGSLRSLSPETYTPLPLLPARPLPSPPYRSPRAFSLALGAIRRGGRGVGPGGCTFLGPCPAAPLLGHSGNSKSTLFCHRGGHPPTPLPPFPPGPLVASTPLTSVVNPGVGRGVIGVRVDVPSDLLLPIDVDERLGPPPRGGRRAHDVCKSLLDSQPFSLASFGP